LKKMILILVFMCTLLVGCTVTTTIPDDANVAVCAQNNTFKYIYKDSTVYEFYTDDVLQSKDMLSIVQTGVDAIGTVQQYLDTTFLPDSCTFSDYVSNTARVN